MNLTLPLRKQMHRPGLTPEERHLRRRLILQDSIALMSLTAIVVCLSVLTYFFFHSFREHRQVLEQRWYARGKQAMAAGHPAAAVEAFRSALSLSTGNRDYELSLAEALAAAGRTEEAYAYFSNLHDATPGDGFIDLQMARLAAKRNDVAQAIDLYRASLNGAWHGEGADRRREIRLELARYLLSQGRLTDAQGELLTAEGNSLDNPSALAEIGSLLVQAGDPADAWMAYQRVVRHSRSRPTQTLAALLAESQIAYSMGQYKRATLALDRYLATVRAHPNARAPQPLHVTLQQQARLQRMMQLIPFYGLPPRQHAERLLAERRIAKDRYQSCLQQLQQAPTSGLAAAQLLTLDPGWQQLGSIPLRELTENATEQQSLQALINQTELLTANLCGPPSGSNALLLQLAQVPDKTE
jgi:tetratricopeptide (TPR) repeat protein